MYKYNIHTNTTDLGSSVSVSEIDGLEKVTTADGHLSLSGASVQDVEDIVASGTITTQSIISTIAQVASATIEALTSTTATVASATIEALSATTATVASATIETLTSTTATVRDLFVTNLTLTTLTVRELFASVVSIDGTLDVYGTTSFFEDTYMNRDATVTRNLNVGGTFTAGNIIKYAGAITLTDTTGEYVWRHATLNPPVIHLALMVTGAGARPIITCLEYSEVDYATWRFFQMSFIGPAPIGGTIQVCFLAIGGG
jgi:hypothetical protein